jgi:hypothetical protein
MLHRNGLSEKESRVRGQDMSLEDDFAIPDEVEGV